MKPEGSRQPVIPYTTEEIIAEAEKLYAFVQRKQLKTNPQEGTGYRCPIFHYTGDKMRNLICVLPLALMLGCGDKDEDTAAEDTGSEDTAAEETE